ncbi:MAG: hypothetical protein V4760_04855 [Bdellovibrionota bacterium]
MKRSFASIALVSLLVGLGPASAGPLKFEKLPDGLPAARENSEIGVLGSAVHDPYAVFYQKLLDLVESKVYGLTLTAVEAPVVQAEKIYYVESLALGLVRKILSDKQIESQYEREILLYRALKIYGDARFSGERIFEIMIRAIDTAKPGTSGIQLPTEKADGSVVYSPNYRYERELTAKEKRELYKQKLAEFTAAGGSLDEVKLMNPESISALPEKAMIEFVEMANGQVRFTQGSAGHILMARGNDVRVAGTLMIVKDKAGVPRVVVISNSSGSYKPDLMPVDELAQKIARMLDIPFDQVLITKGEPTTTQTVKILLKATGVDGEVIKKAIGVMKTDGELAQNEPTSFIPTGAAKAAACRAIF